MTKMSKHFTLVVHLLLQFDFTLNSTLKLPSIFERVPKTWAAARAPQAAAAAMALPCRPVNSELRHPPEQRR